MNQSRFFQLSPHHIGLRLDHVLAQLNPDLSRARLQSLIQQGYVSSDAHSLTEPAHKIKTFYSLTLQIPDPRPLELVPEALPLEIVYEDDHLIVLNKQAGLVVHPSLGHEQGTLVHGLLHHCGPSLQGIGDVMRPGIVHRLDKGTSGLMVVAKTEPAHHGLSQQFAAHSLVRQYQAFCWGRPQRSEGVIETWIGRHPQHRQKMAVLDRPGKKAITSYCVLDYHAPLTLMQCTLQTGRTHQVRVHMTSLGHSLVGDPLYGSSPTLKNAKTFEVLYHYSKTLEAQERPALHSSVLIFEHPLSHKTCSFEVPLPQDLMALKDYMTGSNLASL